MKIRYSLTFKEYVHSQIWGMRLLRRSDWVLIGAIIGTGLFLVALLQVYDVYRRPYYLPVDLFRDVVMFGVGLVLSFLLWPVIGLGLELELRPEEIILKRHFVSIRMPWKFVDVMAEDARYIHVTFRDTRLKIGGASSLGVFVPKRCFSSAGEAEKFYEQARLYCGEAGGQPRPAVVSSSAQPLTH